jgi:hypothetical protein
MPNKAKRFAAKTAIKLGVVGAVVAVVAVADQLQTLTGKKWM